ncbi:ABC transporter ATP-binding protein [Suttonella ornithocola]|uniref:Uncharacterized ABC transporter ATP-binding protein YbbL n=1 Tax=Suttonella ornithocola TaxID=279832 RepID=A0A380MVE8_9GAMM|nr:ATP-binding cassette domain-containing protein [Suttonella ornithocola]SUO96252.1 Uncharacterized ABC transporter ATP-binding protein YbbL [Suttonella ornithocola]
MLILLSFSRLTRYNQNIILLNQATGKLEEGDRIALTGTSGSGKSLLLRALASLDPIDAGEIFYRNQQNLPPREWRAKICYLSQTPALAEGKVEDSLKAPYQYQYHQKQIYNRDFHITRLKMLGKEEDFLNRESYQLSGGEKQIVNLLRSLQFSPQILLLDEPTAALDPESKQQLEQLVLNWCTEQPTRAYIWISHDPEEASRIANRKWQMHKGQLTTDEPHNHPNHN